jgi:microcystin-dependent protein
MPATPWAGELMLVPLNFAPKGWFLCNGALIPVARYPALFAIIGNTFGGDGVTTFALPDLMGRVPVGAGQGPGLLNYALAQSGGVESVMLAASQLPAHAHTIACNSQSADQDPPDGAYPGTPAVPLYAAESDGTLFSDTMLTPSSTQPQFPHENLQPYLTLQWVIAYDGASPFGQA